MLEVLDRLLPAANVSTLPEILVEKMVPEDVCDYWAVSILLEILD